MSVAVGRWVRGRWSVLRARSPRGTGAVESGLLGLRGAAHLVDEVRLLRTRVGELERDHRLLAAHVAALTEAAPVSPEAPPAPPMEAVRLSAVAFYEQRISALEARIGRTSDRRHARAERGGTSDPGTVGFETENER